MPDRLRLILGLKLSTLRRERGLGLKEVARKAGLSVSYLSEIEQGKKYPKPDKLVALAHALGVPYDDLVSLRVDERLDGVRDVIDSPLLRAFPLEMFGVEPQEVVRLLAGVPDRVSALLRALDEVSRTYDARVEHFLYAALRAYQQLHRNHFPALEAAAAAFRAELGWDAAFVPDAAQLRDLLETRFGYRIETEALRAHPDLRTQRSAFRPGPPLTLYVNADLREEQQAFLFAREVGFALLGHTERPDAPGGPAAASFDAVLQNFEAAYVAGALLMPPEAFDAALRALIEQPAWDEDAFLALLERFRATPEMLFYRLTQRAPEAFGLDELFFLRFHHTAGTDDFELTKVFNLSAVPVPHGVRTGWHYCRRWPAMQALRLLDRRQAAAAGRGQTDDGPVVFVQDSVFVDEDGAEFFVVAIARPLALRPGVNSAVSVGFRLGRAFRRTVRFASDPEIETVEVGLACERCPIADCLLRAAPPTAVRAAEARARAEAALAALGA